MTSPFCRVCVCVCVCVRVCGCDCTGSEKEEMGETLCVCAKSGFFVTPWTVARQAPLSMGFSRQEYWSGLSCP